MSMRMSDEKQFPAEAIDDPDLEQALDELDAGGAPDPASEVVAAMAAMIEGVRNAAG